MSWPEDLPHAAIFDAFFNHHDTFERYHIHLVGVQGPRGMAQRTNRFGMKAAVDKLADPYVIVTTVGDDTGSTEYFPVGQYQFPILENTGLPVWDAKCTLISKKGEECTSGLKLTMLDHNKKRDHELLAELEIPRAEMPEASDVATAEWKEFSLPVTEGRLEGLEVVLSIKVTDGASRVVSKEDTEGMYGDLYEGMAYEEQVLEDESGKPEDNALLQCWKNTSTPSSKAVFWVLGRNDCFMHPHVANHLFFQNGYDVFVLNYKMNGHCRKKGWVSDAHFVSHNFAGNFDVYTQDIQQAVDFIQQQESSYEKLLGYAHSTGAPIFLNYLMQNGDEAFDGFVFNSPFLDWGFVGGDMVEFTLKNVGFLERIGTMDNDTKLGVATTPDALANTPIHYLGQEVVVSDWSARLWSLYYFDWETRPLYQVPMTVGFAQGVTKVHRAMKKRFEKKKVITTKPFLVITARGDDVLKSPETLARADLIGPARSEIELNDNGHDIFLSGDVDDTNMAIEMIAVWMKNKKFL